MKNNIRTEPITTLNTAEINTLTDLELDVEKKREFSEYWRNEEIYYVHHILDDECKRAKTCESCKVDFPKKNPKIGSNLVAVHKKRYMRLNVDSFGKRGEPISTTQLERKFYCVETTSLLLERQIVCVEISSYGTYFLEKFPIWRYLSPKPSKNCPSCGFWPFSRLCIISFA